MKQPSYAATAGESTLDEVRRIKEEIAAGHRFDVDAMIDSLLEAEVRHPERYVDLSKRRDNAGLALNDAPSPQKQP